MDFFLKKIDEFWDTPTNLDEKMNELKRKLEVLNSVKEDTESRKSTEPLHPRKKLKKEVELWFRNVERINGEIQHLELKLGGSSVVSRGLFKGNIFKKIQEVEELFQQGKSHDCLVVDNPGWIGQALSTTTLFGGAAKFCMEEIWGYLMGADVQKIGVWGMGGIGKTTIMKHIHNQLLKETGKFDIVIWITVSKEMNIFKMQKWIAQEIDQNMNETLDKVEDKTKRAGMISEMLALKGKYVLILDDLWHKISLEEVGIPEPSNGSKLLVTTRLLNVCHYLDCREVKVPTLSKQDAWSLFLEKVGQDVLNHRDLLPFVESVAEECAGLPLAIITIASSMKGVRDIHVWRNAFHELNRHVKSVNGMEEKVFQQLQFSYDRLGDEKVKQCFLDCALYPEDCEIDNNELINLWITEGLVEEMDSMQTEIDRGYAILDELINSCLVMAEGSYRGVKLHDVVRDMALRIRSVKPRFLVKAGMQSNEILNVQDWNEDLEKASLMKNRKLQIPSQMPPLKCQNLTTLLLSYCSIESIPESFFEQMHGLKVLDLSRNYGIKSLPNSISNLETLTTLLLGDCSKLEKVPSVSKLEALKKLDLGRTKIKEIPDGMQRLVNLKYLDLSGTSIEEILDGILGKLTYLRYLALCWDTLVRGEEIGGLRKLESYAGGMFYDSKELNNYARALEARIKTPSKYSIRVGAYRGEFSSVGKKSIVIYGGDIISMDDGIKVPYDVEELIIRNCTVELCEEGAFLSRFIPTPLEILSSLSRIQIHKCKNIKKLFSSNWLLLHYLPNLKYLHVSGCEDIEEIIALESELEEERISAFKFTVPNLWELSLANLPELKSICSANGVMVCDSIQRITIYNCPKLKRIPLNLPLQDNSQPSPPPSLIHIWVSSMEWWESVEWDHPNDKSLLEPFVRGRR